MDRKTIRITQANELVNRLAQKNDASFSRTSFRAVRRLQMYGWAATPQRTTRTYQHQQFGEKKIVVLALLGSALTRPRGFAVAR